MVTAVMLTKPHIRGKASTYGGSCIANTVPQFSDLRKVMSATLCESSPESSPPSTDGLK